MMESLHQIKNMGLAQCWNLTDMAVEEICKSSKGTLSTMGLNNVTRLTGILVISFSPLFDYLTL